MSAKSDAAPTCEAGAGATPQTNGPPDNTTSRVVCVEGDHWARADHAARLVECESCRYVVSFDVFARFARYRVEAACYRDQLAEIAALHDPREWARLRTAEYHAALRRTGFYDRRGRRAAA